MENKELESETSNNVNPSEISTTDTSALEITKSEEKPPSTDAKPSDTLEVTNSSTSKIVESPDKIKHKKVSKKKSKAAKIIEAEPAKTLPQNSSETITADITLSHQIGNLSQRLEKCQLEPITIEPGPNAKTISITHEETASPRVIKLNQTFKFPSEFEGVFEEKHSPTKECFTQTSKTFVTKPLENINTASMPFIPQEVVNVDDFVPPVTEVSRPLSPPPPPEDVDDYAYPLFVPYDPNQNNSANEDFCTLFPPKSPDNFASAAHLRRMSWPQAVITGPVEQPKSNTFIFPPIGDMAYRVKSQTLPCAATTSNIRPDNLKRSCSQRPLEPSMNLQAQFRPSSMYDTAADVAKSPMMTNDCEPRTRSEPFILPALNNQNRPELQILQRLLPPNRLVMSEPCECPGSSGEITPTFNRVSPVSSKSPDLSWRYIPQAIRSDTSNEYTYGSRHRPDDLSIQVYSRTKISPRLTRQKSSILAAGSRLSFHSSTKFSPKNDNYSIISQRTAKSIGYRDSRPASGSIIKRRVNKYNNLTTRCQARKVGENSPRIKRNLPKRRNYQSSNAEEHNVGSETDSTGTRTSAYTATADTVSLPKALAHVNSDDWEVAMKGMTEIVELSRHMEHELLEQEMPAINRKIIQMLRSPRSQACRVACEVSGELFVTMKLTKRPEFDEIVDLLLCKTADTNRFIRKDANIALDRMVTYIPPFHAVRALCSKGPGHKNHLVRCATVRLLVCIAVLASTENILTSNEYTRKRMFTTMAKFLMDKHLETRKYGERLFKMFKRNKYFEEAFYRDVDMDIIEKLGKSLLRLSRK